MTNNPGYTQGRYVDAALAADLEHMLASARTRLLLLARRHGIMPDAVDDVVQEALMEAWRHLDHLRDPGRFNAWLDGICRNVCRRWSRAQRNTALQQVNPLSYDPETPGSLTGEEVADPSAFDPAEELSRQDLALLLDRALGYLPGNARELLELCYLAELPQREAAVRLGLTISALEARLHRARRQLLQILNGELRADAESCGLLLDQDPATSWRESREWCMYCGRQRLRGTFEPLSHGRFNLRLRCPHCSLRYNTDVFSSGGIISLAGQRSFRPALKRLIQVTTQYYQQAFTDSHHRCLRCGALKPMEVVFSDEPVASTTLPHKARLVLDCPTCGLRGKMWVGGPACWSHPEALQFMAQHPRCVLEPEMLVECAGQKAIYIRLSDVTSTARLTLLLHSRTLQVLAVVRE